MPGHRRLPTRTLEPASALARGPALLDLAGGEAVSFWTRVSRPALVLGRAARSPALNDAALARADLSVHQRASGGGAVLWDDGLLALDVVLPAGHPLLSPDVVASYGWLGTAVGDALAGLGMEAKALTPQQARSAPPPSGLVGTACFALLSPGEVVINGRKVAGLCQVRRTSGSLLQLGLVRKMDHALLIDVLGGTGDDASQFARTTRNLAEVDENELISAVDAHMAQALGSPRTATESAEEEAAIKALAEERFAAL